ncbi:MAG: N-acetylornithine carbamoyltransferase [Planctomycetota bacterium]|nr:N-acetylornithine carbamoyltransferase [Planctomycetota bacterium]
MSAGPDIQGRDVVTLDTFSGEEIRHITARARALKQEPLGSPLAGRSLAMVFFDPSLRTRASFSIAFGSLGGTVIDLVAGRDLWPLEMHEGAVMDSLADEHVRDAVRVLSEYADIIAIRALARGGDWAQARRDTVIVSFQKHATVPIFNMESVLDHPCQALGDALTVEDALGGETRGKRVALTWTYHPKARPLAVPHGVGMMAAKLGMDLTVARPEGYDFDPALQRTMEHAAQRSGGSLDFVDDPAAAVENADIVYAASWGSPSLHANPDEERALRDRHRSWQVTPELMGRTATGHFMHAMPIRRNVEAADAVVDGPSSLVIEQAANRLHVQRALFREVLGV